MDFRPFENTLEALYNPKFMNHSSVNMGLLEPHSDQQAAMGKIFTSNSRTYRYGRTTVAIAGAGVQMSMSLVTFEVTFPSDLGYNCQSIRKMKVGDYGIFVMPFAGIGGGGSGDTTDYNYLTNKPIYNLNQSEVIQPYTDIPASPYEVGDLALVHDIIAQIVDGVSVNIGVKLTFLYCLISTVNYPTEWFPPQENQKCMIGNLYNEGSRDPFGGTLYFTSAWLPITSPTNLFDARIVQEIERNQKKYGWVWLSMYQGDIDLEVTPPAIVLPPVPGPGLRRTK